MTLTKDRLQTALGKRPFRFYEQIDSTNTVALEWLQAGAPTGAVVIADEQTQGRGRLGRAWYAPPGTALMCSTILHPPADSSARVTMIGAVSVYDLVTSFGVDSVSLKWPNDVRVNERKISGVLSEGAWSGDRLLGVALGIGLNVRIDFADTPLANTAISLETALGEPVDRLLLLVRLLTYIDIWAERIDTDALYRTWKGRLSTLGQRVSIQSIEGVVEDADDQGALLVRADDNRIHRIIAGDIATEARG